MKKHFFSLTLFLLSLIANGQVELNCDNEAAHWEDCRSRLNSKYWDTRQSFRNHFIINDLDQNGNLTGDGIGEWDEENLRYTKAGYGLPPNKLLMTYDPEGLIGQAWRDCDNIDVDENLPNVMNWGDSPLQIAYHLVTICTEYELLKRNGQTHLLERNLNEIFLLLQAFRRLDMTANQLFKAYIDNCDCGEPINGMTVPINELCEFEPDLSGYSGFFLRNDTPSDFYLNYSNEVDESWQVGGVLSTVACSDEQAAPCNFGDLAVVSQDMIIGMLYGLSFVKKYIPYGTSVTVNGEHYYPLSIAQNIAHGMVKRLKNYGWDIRYPGSCGPFHNHVLCEGLLAGKSVNNTGNKVTGFKYGIIRAANEIITPLFDEFGKEGKILWDITKAIMIDLDGITGNHDNVRMTIELMAVFDDPYMDHHVTQRNVLEYNLLLMHNHGWAALHDRNLSGDHMDNMLDILCSYSCPGPCYQYEGYENGTIGPDYPCYNNGTVNSGWCSGARWQQNVDVVYQCVNQSSHRAAGWDFMTAYNLFYLNGGMNESGYFDDNGTTLLDQNLDGIHIDFEGPEFICLGQESTFTVIGCRACYPVFDWKVSPNLEIVSSTPNYCDPQLPELKESITVRPKTGVPSGEAWIEAEEDVTLSNAYGEDLYDEDCHQNRRFRKMLEIGSPPAPQIREIKNCEGGFFVLEILDPADTDDVIYEWQFDNNVFLTDIKLGGTVVTAFTIPGASVINYTLTITSACGVHTYPGTVYCFGYQLLVAPNPTTDNTIGFQIKNFDADYQVPPDGVEISLTDEMFNIISTRTYHESNGTFNLDGTNNGYHYLTVIIEDKGIYTSKFLIQK